MAYGEQDFEYTIFCIHQRQLVNQGITFCANGHDPSQCETCKWRKEKKVKSKVTWASTETESDID